ncbi:hypothetical protein COOONC_21054 [Cooperia oncophora]
MFAASLHRWNNVCNRHSSNTCVLLRSSQAERKHSFLWRYFHCLVWLASFWYHSGVLGIRFAVRRIPPWYC